jgi:hypothetical protein
MTDELEKVARECAEAISRMDGVTGLLRNEMAAVILAALRKVKGEPGRQLCQSHPGVDYRTAWGCPECVAELRAQLATERAERDQLAHDLKTIRGIIGADGSLVEQIAEKWEGMEERLRVIEGLEIRGGDTLGPTRIRAIVAMPAGAVVRLGSTLGQALTQIDGRGEKKL